MSEWETKKLGDVLSLEYGKPLPKDDRDSSGAYPVYGANGVKARSNKFYCESPSIIVGRKGSAGECNLTEEKFWPLDVTYFVKFDDSQHDLLFLYHFLTFQNLPRLAKGVKPGINRNDVYDIEVNLPPLVEQKRIVSILDEAFGAIERAKENAEKNLQNAREILKSIVSDATSGKLTADWRASEKTENASALLQRRLAQRRADWNGTGKYKEPKSPVTNSPVDIPTSWTLASPEHLTTHIVDCPHSTPKWTKSGVICLRTTNFQIGFLDVESVRFVSEATYNERIMRLEPKSGDVLYSREGGILGIACILPDDVRACLGQRMMLLRLDTCICVPQYFVAVLNSSLILSEVKRLTGGAASPHLNIRDIRKFPIPLPPIKEQREIVERFDALSTQTKRIESICQHKLAALDELKQSILQKAFTGKLTAKSPELEAVG